MHKGLDEFVYQPDLTTDYGVSWLSGEQLLPFGLLVLVVNIFAFSIFFCLFCFVIEYV